MLSDLTSDYTDLDIITFVMLSVKIRNFSSHYRYIESTKRNSDFSKPLISCHYAIQESNNIPRDYICISQILKRFNLLRE